MKKTTSKKRVAVTKARAINAEPDIHEPGALPLMMYRRIAVTFLFVVATALVAVLYLSTVQALIRVTSARNPVTAEFIAGVYETPTSETEIRGLVVSGTLGATKTFTPDVSHAAVKEEDAIATGSVRIYNTLTFAQPLVATTRLLSTNGVLFRLKDAVTVPAQGSIEAEIYADVPGASGNIPPSKFSIPGLSQARQTAVYAESSQSFTGGVVTTAVISQENIEEALSSLQASLEADAMSMLEKEVSDQTLSGVYETQVIDRSVSIEPDTQAESFDVTLTIKVTGVFYDRAALEKIALVKLSENLGQGQTFTNVDLSSLQVSLENYNEKDGEARVHILLSSNAMTSQTSRALAVENFVGLTEDEVRQLLLSQGVATKVEVDFFPFWIRTVPRLKDHIYIEIQ